MVEQVETPGNQFNAALSALTQALEDAAGAALALERFAPAVENLTRLVGELEDRMERARELLGMERARELLGQEGFAASDDPTRPIDLASREEATVAEPETAGVNEQPAGSGSSVCFLLEVRAISGPLDLKSVDSSVSATADVVDVALLDYDGRRATLKVWFEASADLPAARAALRESLQRHLGGQPAEISLERAEEPAA